MNGNREVDRLENKYFRAFQIIMIASTVMFSGFVGYICFDYFIRPKVSTSHYHFNVQYRVGNETAMSEVVNNTLYPLLQIYDRNPEFRGNIEMQSLTLEWMNKTNPECSDLLRKLVLDTKQIQLVMVQYSSALAIAYPYIDMYKSIVHTQELIEDFFGVYPESGISRAIMLQEGQFMLGASRIIEDIKNIEGNPVYDTLMVTKEALSFFGVESNAPIYRYQLEGLEEIFILPYVQTVMEGDVFHSVLWFMDGELLVAGEEQYWTEDGYWEMNASFFEEIEFMTRNHENRLKDLARQGNRFLHLDEWVNTLLDRGQPPLLDQYVPETHWQTYRYRGPFVWMAQTKGGTPFSDGEVCSRNYYTHQKLLATEIMLNYSHFNLSSINASVYSSYYQRLNRAWLDLAEAEVTDTTGVSPRDFEGYFAFNKTQAALNNATEIMSLLVNVTSEWNNTVYTNNGSIQIVALNQVEGMNPVMTNQSEFINFTKNLGSGGQPALPVVLELMNANGLNVTSMILETPWKPALNYSRVRVSFPETTDMEETWAYVKFKGLFNEISYSPSLIEYDTINLSRSEYYPDTYEAYEDWDSRSAHDNFELYLPLANGLVYSIEGRYAVIKNCSQSHVCMKWNPDEIRFMQTKIINPHGETWEYFILQDVSINQALEFANLVNAFSVETFDGDDLS